MRTRAVVLAIGITAVGLRALTAAQEERRWSPNGKRYAVSEAGQETGNGQERQRLVIYTDAGVLTTVAHVWLVEPDGARRAGIRGCEAWGWVDESRIFCEGSINPSTGVYLVFDAETGAELHELFGGHFVWSPDRSHLASLGNVPHFSAVEEKTDSLEIEGKRVYPAENDRRHHWFRSDLVWSANSRRVAVVDYRTEDRTLWLVVASAGRVILLRKLPWMLPRGDRPPERTVVLRWEGQRVIIGYGRRRQMVGVPASVNGQ